MYSRLSLSRLEDGDLAIKVNLGCNYYEYCIVKKLLQRVVCTHGRKYGATISLNSSPIGHD